MKTIALAGTFDTKGKEFLYAKGLVEELGLRALTIHTGVFEPEFTPDVGNEEVAAAAGKDIREIVKRKDRAMATEALSEGMKKLIPKLYKEGRFDGILSFGGSGGTSMATPAMRELPIGVPKVMVSTMASGNVSQYVGTSDIVMMPSIVDVAGLNKISKRIFSNAVLAVVGMVEGRDRLKPDTAESKPLIAASMFGVTTPCIDQAKAYLEKEGYEVLVFHATGTGGKTMESLIDAGFFAGVLDMTTTEWCDEVVGGVLAAGPDRCGAAVRHRIP
ncbi:MAG: Tm-1-like ATP-binding domain-containing protein, partial [Schwartzia sp.]|nr:Tm-1-like ATP-binding domain-containing protein [Schwartzia sp. (in: firmicutes)]